MLKYLNYRNFINNYYYNTHKFHLEIIIINLKIN